MPTILPTATDAPIDTAAAPRHPRLRRLLDYWLSKRREGKLPGRADIDPLDFAYVLGNVTLVDVVDGNPPRFRFRLVGTNIQAKHRVDMTGRFVEEFPEPEAREVALQRCRDLVARRDHVYNERSLVLDGRPWSYSALWLPLASDGATVDMILCAQFFEA